MTIDAEALTASLRRLAGKAGDSGVIDALHELTQACVDLFGVTGSGIMIADQQNVTRYVAASDGRGRFLEQAEAQTGQGVCMSAFVDNTVVHSRDLAHDSRWPELAAALSGRGIRAVLGVPVRLGAIPVGTLDVFRDHPHEWGDGESRALVRYSDVVETTLTAALQAHTAGELAGQLQYALDYRVIIERAVGFLMATHRIDAVAAFNQLRRVARSNRMKIGQVAEQLLETGQLAATS
jgi:transcriptional regulator with GAF, ATPase, and Fis domain